MKLSVAVGDELRAELARNRMSQSSLAASVTMTGPQVSRRLSGIVPFNIDELVEVCSVLDLSVGDLLARVEPKTAGPDVVKRVTA